MAPLFRDQFLKIPDTKEQRLGTARRLGSVDGRSLTGHAQGGEGEEVGEKKTLTIPLRRPEEHGNARNDIAISMEKRNCKRSGEVVFKTRAAEPHTAGGSTENRRILRGPHRPAANS